jgi:D-threo-aldose 1-dehydrogenase
MRSAQEVVDNVEAMRLTVPAALWQELRAEGLIDPNAPVPGT